MGIIIVIFAWCPENNSHLFVVCWRQYFCNLSEQQVSLSKQLLTNEEYKQNIPYFLDQTKIFFSFMHFPIFDLFIRKSLELALSSGGKVLIKFRHWHLVNGENICHHPAAHGSFVNWVTKHQTIMKCPAGRIQ